MDFFLCWDQAGDAVTGDGWRFTGTVGYDAANNGRTGAAKVMIFTLGKQ